MKIMAIDCKLPDCAKQSTVTFFFQHLNSGVRQRGAGLLERFKTGIEVDKGELQTQ